MFYIESRIMRLVVELLGDRLTVGQRPLKPLILVRFQASQQKKIPPRAEFLLGGANELLHLRLGIEDFELVI